MHTLRRTVQVFYSAALLLLCCMSVSCSLSYITEEKSTEVIPELVFENLTFYRVEEAQTAFILQAQALEQYKNENSFYGNGITFTALYKDGSIDTMGKAARIQGNQNDNTYTLFDGAQFEQIREALRISGNNFRWNADTQVLISGAQDEVHIFQEKNQLNVTGRGFSANGITMEYRFEQNVSGSMTSAHSASDEQK